MKQSDKAAMDRIVATMEDYESDMNNYAGQMNKGDRTRAGQLCIVDSFDRPVFSL